jgi:hypothetical protein
MRFAVKRLTRSDLTFFEYHFRRQNVGNQKSINLNRNVFVDLIFPVAGEVTGGGARQFPLPVTIYGPGMRSEPQVVTRKVISKSSTQKNWRLNGEFVPDPESDPARYHGLSADDFVIFGFEGENGLPAAFYLVLLAQSEEVDVPIRDDITSTFLGTRNMAEIPESVLAEVVSRSPTAHPIRELLEAERDQALQEAALGSAEGAAKLLRQPSLRRMSADALAKARQKAEAAGRNGEVLVDDWLTGLVRKGQLLEAVWKSETNAVNPWDFEITEHSGEKVRIEVKSTTGPFERPIHISQAEILAASSPEAQRTDILRVYALSEDSAWVRISRDVRSFASAVTAACDAMPPGVVPDGYCIAPASLGAWTDAIHVKFEEEEDV